MKRLITFALAMLCLACFFTNVAASSEVDMIITIDNVDIIFDSQSVFTDEEKHIIAEYLTHNSSIEQTYGLMCNLFGHKNTTDIVTTITHCVSPSSPRCLREKWEIITCSRCGNVDTTLLDFAYINCCPES